MSLFNNLVLLSPPTKKNAKSKGLNSKNYFKPSNRMLANMHLKSPCKSQGTIGKCKNPSLKQKDFSFPFGA
jgi:hypothetical protein